MSSTKKFVYTIKADYEGESDLKKLQADLKAIGQIDAFSKQQESWRKTNAEFVKAKEKVRELRAALREGGGDDIAKQYAAASKEVQKLSTSLAKQKSQIDSSRDSIRQSGVALNSLSGAYEKLKGSAAGQGTVLAAQMQLGVRSIKSVESEIAGLRLAYTTLKNSGTQSMKELAVAKDRLRTKIALLKQETNGWSSHLAKVQEGWAGILVTVGAIAAASRGIQFFAGFDDSMRDVQAYTQAGEAEMKQYTDLAKELGATTRFTAAEVAQGMAELTQSGIKSYQELAGILPNVTNLTSASGMQFKESADMLTDTLKQFNMQTSEAGRVTDVIVAGYTNAGHSAEQLGRALSYVGPIAKSMGYSIEETVAIINTLAEAGYKGERGGTALRGGFARLIKPTNEAVEILEKYKIQVYDSQGAIRSFADIIEDVGKAAMNQTEMLTLFGQEAGPGMQALVNQGAGSIRGFQKILEDAGGTAAKIASDKEGGIGGSLRSLMSSLQAIVIAFGDSLAPAIQVAADSLTVLARIVADTPRPLLMLAGGLGAVTVGFAAWKLGVIHIVAALRLAKGDVVGLGGKINDMTTKTQGATTALKFLGKGFAIANAAMLGWNFGTWLNNFDMVKKAGIALTASLVKGFLYVKKAWTWITGGDTAAIQQEIDSAEQIFSEMFAEVGKQAAAAGNTVGKSYKDMATAANDSAAKQKESQAAAVEAMKTKYQEYAEEIKRLQDQIAGREQSLAEQLRSMSRSGMTDIGAWEDRKKEAEEYEKAADKAMAAGNFEEAVKLYDKAKNAFADLNKEVKDGEKVLVSQQQGLEASMEGVGRVGNKTIEVLKKQQSAARDAMEDLTKQSGFQDLSKGMDDAKKKWLDNWLTMKAKAVEGIEAVEDRLLAIKDKNVTIYINEKRSQASRLGGLIGNIQALRLGGAVMMAGGGALGNALKGYHFPGYGGGDRRHVIAEDGEVMIRKESVRMAGLRAALAFNAGNWQVVIAELMKRFSVRMQTGGPVGRFSIPALPPIPMQVGGSVLAAAGGGKYMTMNIYNQEAEENFTMVAPTESDYVKFQRLMISERKRVRLSGK